MRDGRSGRVPYCEAHPDTETELQCGRCGRYICPRDLVHAPGGIRCEDCARLRRPPMYELAATDYLWAALVAAGLALPLGFAGALLWQPRTVSSIFYLVVGLLLGWAAGTVVSEAISRATGGKRGVPVQLIAGAGVVAAGVLRLVVASDLDLVHRDVGGMLAVAVGIAIAWNRLR